MPSGKRQIDNGLEVLPYHNDPKHSANEIFAYLERKTADKTLTVMDWPPQSPDLNNI